MVLACAAGAHQDFDLRIALEFGDVVALLAIRGSSIASSQGLSDLVDFVVVDVHFVI